MNKVSLLELRKVGGIYKKKRAFLLAIIILSFSMTLPLFFGTNSDSYIYKILSSTQQVDSKKFFFISNCSLEDADALLGEGYIIVKNEEKSLAAADRLLEEMDRISEKEIYMKYGEDAYPVLLNVIYLKREAKKEIKEEKKIKKEEKEKKKIKREKKEEYKHESKKEKKVESENATKVEEKEAKDLERKEVERYITPRELSPPKLVEKIIYCFIFIFPSFFLLHIYSSSLIEDKIKRRIEVLMSLPIKDYEIILGKILPYLIVSLLILLILSLIFSKKAIIFFTPPIIFLFAIHTYIAVTSRSYNEMTFLAVLLDLIVIFYLILPAVFSAEIPIAKISPATLFLEEKISIYDYLASVIPLLAMSIFLIYMSSTALSSEILHSRTNPLLRAREIFQKLLNTKFKVFLASFIIVFFVLFFEFFLIFLLFIFPFSGFITAVLLSAAFIEEFSKGIILYSSRNPIIVGLGFFLAEKAVTIFAVMQSYGFLLMPNLIFIPLLLHITTCFVFTYLLNKGFAKALVSASLLHFAYNYAIVRWLI